MLSTARSERISGDLVDRLIYDHHLELHRFTPPADTAARLALTARCRDAKEQLSTTGAVCMPGEGGLLLLSQDSFESLIDGPVKTSARLTRDVIRRSGRTPDAAVLIGGGAHIPLVTSVMESWLDVPVIVPAQPELVAAEGAALLARPAAGVVMSPTQASAPHETSNTVETRHTVEKTAPPRTRRRLLLAGSVLTVVAAIGLQRLEPGADILLRVLGFQALQAGGPDVHVGESPEKRRRGRGNAAAAVDKLGMEQVTTAPGCRKPVADEVTRAYLRKT